MMNNQIKLFSIDTKAFYTDKERLINTKTFKIKYFLEVVQKCEAIKYILSNNDMMKDIDTSKMFDGNVTLENIFNGYEDKYIYAYYIKQDKKYKYLRIKINQDDYIENDEDTKLIESYRKYFRDINKLLKVKYKKNKDYKLLVACNDKYIKLKDKLNALDIAMAEEHINNINIKRELNQLACYSEVKDDDGNITYAPRTYKQISLFISYLTDVLGLESDTLTTDLVIVRVYHYNVLDCLINNNFTFLGKEFVAFGASAGQTRTKKCVFINKEILEKYANTLMCGLTKDLINKSPEQGCNITKWLAYQSLINSATDKWESFDINKAIIIPDWQTDVKDTIDFIKTEKVKKPLYKKVYLEGDELEIEIENAKQEKRKPRKMRKILEGYNEILAITGKPERIEDYLVPINHSDGCGWILSSESNKSFMFRLPWFKGLLVSIDYVSYIKEYCDGNDAVIDIDGRTRHLIAEDIKYVFTESQWKMHKYYKWLADVYNKENGTNFGSWDMYKHLYNKYGCHARKCNEEREVFKDANISYQMCQTLTDFDKKLDLDVVCQNTVDYIVNAYSNIDSMLDVLGCNKDNVSYFQQALKLYPELLRDKFTYNELTSSLSKIKKNAKFAKIKVNGKYTFLAPDVIAWMNHTLKCTKNSDKILQKEQCYCKLFRQDKKLAVLRSPHLFREWAICENTAYKADSKLQAKYYSTNCVYTSSLSLISRILQFDNDGDTALCISDYKWIELGEKNMKDIVPLFYEMGKAQPRIINNQAIFEGMVTAYKYSNIGQYSNLLTAGWNTENVNLDILKIICALNNYSIDAGKTLQMVQIDNDKLKEEYKKISGLDLPHFFQYAKDKDVDKLEDINKSFVNQICAKFENIDKDIQADANKRRNKQVNSKGEPLKDTKQLFDFSSLDKFNYKNLMSTKKKVEADQRLIDLYNDLNDEKSASYLEAKKDKDSYYAIISGCKGHIKKYMLDNKINMSYATDVLVQYIYTDKVMKERQKTLLWEVFGRQIVENIKHNVKRVPDGYLKCTGCGRIVKRKTNNQKKCSCCR